jgi:hypothetical protein
MLQGNAFCNLNSYLVSFGVKYSKCCYLVSKMKRLRYTVIVQDRVHYEETDL